jgi:hypothetical protein
VRAVLSIPPAEFDKPRVSQEKQIYFPAMQKYEAALKRMRSLLSTISEDDIPPYPPVANLKPSLTDSGVQSL